MNASPNQRVAIPVAALLLSQVSVNLGAAFAKHLFPLIGPEGVTALRTSMAAGLLLALWRPWHVKTGVALGPLLVYGAALGVMNVLIYQAFARIPIGIAVAIEVTGPLAVVLFNSRRLHDFLWLGLSCVGLWMLLPLRSSVALDPVGVACALGAAACWALYIVAGRRVVGSLGGGAVAWGMVIAALLTLPIGIVHAGTALWSPGVLWTGLGVALLSSALPYSLEMVALRQLPAVLVGLLLSAAPAIAAVAAWLVIGEVLTASQWLAIGCIVAASAGSAFTARSSALTG